MFQSEGYIGGQFSSKESYIFYPRLSLSQNASDSSIEFLVMLWLIFDKKLAFGISRNSPSRFFHIRLQGSGWDVILNTFIPYLRYVYGDKYKGLAKLKDIYRINKEPNPSKRDQAEVIKLVYTLVDNSQRKISLKDKVHAVIGESDLDLDTRKEYSNNNEPLSILFILGFQLGDGYFYIHIRDVRNALWFIPLIRIQQKNTLDNRQLIQDMIKFLKGYNIHATLEQYRRNEDGGIRIVILLVIQNMVNVRRYVDLIKDHREFMYWKEEQIDLIINVLVVISASATHWKQGKLAVLRLIYTKLDHERVYTYDHWARRLDEIFEGRLRNFTEFYICFAKNNHWSVRLPEAFNVRPKAKSFSVAAYNNSSEEALKAAIQYRDDLLNEWLTQRGLK